MENDVPHRPGKLYKAKTELWKKPSGKKGTKSSVKNLV
jgi:hypothetical protein